MDDQGAILFECETIERPFAGQIEDYPAVPEGIYTCKQPAPGKCYELQNVPGLTAVVIQAATWYWQLSSGIALGKTIEPVQVPPPPDENLFVDGLTLSKETVAAFENLMAGADFTIEIVRSDSFIQKGVLVP